VAITDPDFPVPSGLTTGEFALRPIKATDAEADYAAVMETREQLRLWEQSDWPADDFTVDGNREDLVGLEERHDAHSAYTYTVVDPAGTEALGCVYVFPIGAKFLARSEVTPLDDALWDAVEAVVYFWARRSRMDVGMDARLLDALRGWFATEWGLSRVGYVTNEQFRQQVELLERTDLRRRFELREPGKAGAYLVYG
jgi:hypothetical protein